MQGNRFVQSQKILLPLEKIDDWLTDEFDEYQVKHSGGF